MRLLHFDAPDRLILTDFRGKPIPPYAILSHRWSDSETLIEDIRNESYKEREEGYRKLKFCAEQAAKDGLQYFWIDTCCIDRWDNNERSKAINSMFQWYRKAARCYVFLSDVSLTAVTETATAPCIEWEASFCRSPWFTRGWTLQELIAPVSVDFFSREGQRIGDKASLEPLIHSITSIPLTALRNEPLDQFSTSERVTWAKNRATTEEEDIVYCLLGLLGISMPATYGEGKQSALRRLQAEVEGADCTPLIIPFSRNESFVGREAQLTELEAKLFSNDQTTTMLAILGPGGTGKSQLALEVAHRTRLNNKNCLIFWIDASDTDSLYRSYASIAQKLSIPGCDDDQADTMQIVKRCVVAMSAQQCLLIYDNVEGTTLQPSGLPAIRAADLADFLPQSKLCSVIFTTTESNTTKTLAPQNVVALRELTPDTALRMLQSLQQYQARLHEHNQAALERSNDLREGEQGESSLRKAVAATLSLSIGQVQQSNAIAAEYLYFAACVDRKDIPLGLLKAASPQAREDAIITLDRYALVTRRPAESAFDVHRLVHQALREQLQVQGRLHECTQRTVTQLLQVFPNSDHSNRSKWRRLLPHAQYALSHSKKDDNQEKTNLAENCAEALVSDGQYNRAEELCMQVMESRRRVLGSEHPDTLISVNNLGSVLESQGKHKEAEAMHRRALEAREKTLGREHPSTLASMSNLGLVLERQGKYEEAEAMHRRALEGSEKVLGRKHPNTLTSVNNLGSVLESQGKYKEAEAMHQRALEGCEKTLGREHPSTLVSLSNLGGLLESQGKHKEAEAMHQRALEAREKTLGREHPDTLISVNNLGSVLESQGKHKEAEVMHRRALEAREKTLGREHPDTLASVSNLGWLLESQGKYKEAEAMHRRALEAREKTLGREHPDTLASVNNLGSVLKSQGKHKEAEAMHRRALEAREKTLGREHPDTLASMSNLGLVLERQGKYEEAEAMHQRALEAREKTLGREHPSTLASVNNLGLALDSQGKYKEAEAMHQRALEGCEKTLGREHPDTLISVNNLGSVLESQGKHKESLDLYNRACDGNSVVLGEHHPTTQACRQHRSKVLALQER
ncbi:kinesin light chain 3 [Boeremia exigua]|uniref:kinesin light chain 3 n=1 Tax=Boeremia exigua TaxID=749465 RepID=UPI001E8DB116|nr:kinesin light chain 3 [Boeremia exigua]KAH6629430.1 kinesin light chain 3 [Boeremia exigua]